MRAPELSREECDFLTSVQKDLTCLTWMNHFTNRVIPHHLVMKVNTILEPLLYRHVDEGKEKPIRLRGTESKILRHPPD